MLSNHLCDPDPDPHPHPTRPITHPTHTATPTPPHHPITHPTHPHAGEGHRQDLDDILAACLELYGEQGLLDNSPLPEALERDRDPRLAASPLRFPGAAPPLASRQPLGFAFKNFQCTCSV